MRLTANVALFIHHAAAVHNAFFVAQCCTLLDPCCRAVKTIIAESCDATNQAKAMGYMTAGWGVGTIAGPTIGGLLANPCDSFASSLPACEPGSWLQERYQTADKSISWLLLLPLCVGIQRPSQSSEAALTDFYAGLQAIFVALSGISCHGLPCVDEQLIHDVRNSSSVHVQVHKAE